MSDPTRRFGAVLWETEAPIDDAIRVVKAFDNPRDAINLVALACEEGEQWAVVDLRTMQIIAEGARAVLPAPL